MKALFSPPVARLSLLLVFLTEMAHSRPCQDWCGHLDRKLAKSGLFSWFYNFRACFPCGGLGSHTSAEDKAWWGCFCAGYTVDDTWCLGLQDSGAAVMTLERKTGGLGFRGPGAEPPVLGGA